jgi:hypothetical protein
MKNEYDNLRLQSETNLSQIKKKNQETLNDLQEQIQQLNRDKIKYVVMIAVLKCEI